MRALSSDISPAPFKNSPWVRARKRWIQWKRKHEPVWMLALVWASFGGAVGLIVFAAWLVER